MVPTVRTEGARSNPRTFESSSTCFAASFVSRFGYFFFRSSRLPNAAVQARSHCSSRRAAHMFPPTSHRPVARNTAASERTTTRLSFMVFCFTSGLRRPRSQGLVSLPDLESKDVRPAPGSDQVGHGFGRQGTRAALHEGCRKGLRQPLRFG